MPGRLDDLVQAAMGLAVSEIERYGLPSRIHFDLSVKEGRRIATHLGARVDLVEVGIALMDVKLGQAFSEKRLADHVTMSEETAKEFLSHYDLSDEERRIVLNSVAAHHGTVPFASLEAEICANADCYRFIHPRGVLSYMTVVARRTDDFHACLEQVEAKLDEKRGIVSLPLVRQELLTVYEVLKSYIALARG